MNIIHLNPYFVSTEALPRPTTICECNRPALARNSEPEAIQHVAVHRQVLEATETASFRTNLSSDSERGMKWVESIWHYGC